MHETKSREKGDRPAPVPLYLFLILPAAAIAVFWGMWQWCLRHETHFVLLLVPWLIIVLFLASAMGIDLHYAGPSPEGRKLIQSALLRVRLWVLLGLLAQLAEAGYANLGQRPALSTWFDESLYLVAPFYFVTALVPTILGVGIAQLVTGVGWLRRRWRAPRTPRLL